MKIINTITIVGGGTSGCISALMLKRAFPQKHIKIVESTNLGIVGVGESSTEHWADFCNYVGIFQLDPILKAKATFKYGVHFRNWSSNKFSHFIDSPYDNKLGSYYYNYGYLISNNCEPKEMCPNIFWENKFSLNHFKGLNDSPTNQYHFDTFALNEFLHQECLTRGIEIIKDELIDIKLNNETGEIEYLISEETTHHSDFFVDCSGFKRFILHNKCKIPWKSYSEYFPLNSAIAFPTREMEEYNAYTLSTARSAGWSWKIPVQGRTGNGYVYSDNFLSVDDAHREMEDEYGEKLEIAKHFKFDPGRLEKSWHKNCYSVGLAQSFVEPLEATSIGSVIQQMFCFIHFLPSYDYERCNNIVNLIFDNIVDFVQAHYLVQKEDNNFWKEVKYNLKLTSNLEYYLDMWKNRLPMDIDLLFCPWGMYKTFNYIPILYGLNWFDNDKIRNEYLNFNYHTTSQNEFLEYENHQNNSFLVGHKRLINILKNNHETTT